MRCSPSCERSMFGSIRKNPFRRSLSSSSRSSTSESVDGECLREDAKNSQEYDLEQKIELELKMQEGTNKLLAACRYQLQALEAAKSLLTSNERMNAYVFELQRRKSHKQHRNTVPILNHRFQPASSSPSRGKVAVSDIRIPLIWKDSDHFKNRGDYRRFAVFCLLKLGTEVHDTAMLSNVDRSMTDVAFEDVIVFNNVPHDFEFRLEVYSYVLQEDLSIVSASNKLKQKISYSVSKAMGKKLVNNIKEDLAYKGSVPGLELVAHATLRLQDSNSRIKTHDLVTVTADKSRHQLPLFGHFCCRMAAQPQCMAEETYTGFLSLVQQIGNLTGSRRMWCSLKNFSLSLWANAADISAAKPDIVVPVKQCTKVLNEENANSYPRHTFRIICSESSEFVFAADTSTELLNWIAHIQQHIQDYVLWKPASDSVVEMPSPNIRRHSQYTKNRNSSLYDETPFHDGPESPGCGGFLEGGNRVSTPAFWSSSSSSSTSNSIELMQKPRPKSLFLKPTVFHANQ